jgi:hypothetical protein
MSPHRSREWINRNVAVGSVIASKLKVESSEQQKVKEDYIAALVLVP